jgi:hypothetical protein
LLIKEKYKNSVDRFLRNSDQKPCGAPIFLEIIVKRWLSLLGMEKSIFFFNAEDIERPPRITFLADRQYKNDLSRTAMQFNIIPTERENMPKKLEKALTSGK